MRDRSNVTEMSTWRDRPRRSDPSRLDPDIYVPVSRRDEALIRRVSTRAAEDAIVAAPGPVGDRSATPPRMRRGGIAGVSVAVAVVSLTVVAAVALWTGRSPRHTATGTARPTAAVSSAPSSAIPSARPSTAPAVLAWQRSGAVIVDETTAATYLYRDGVLRPIANDTSADLILGTARPTTVKVAHATLASAPFGETIGIVGAPATLPPASGLLAGGWAVCSVAGSTTNSTTIASSAGDVGATGFIGYGTGLTAGDGLGNDGLVVSSAGADYLIWLRMKYLITDPVAVFAALHWIVTPLPVSPRVLTTMPAGTVISPTALPTTAPTLIRLPGKATLCVGLTPAGAAAHTVLNPLVGAGTGPANLIIPRGSAVLVRASSGAKTLYLVTDRGIRFPIADSTALASLGYRSAPTVIVPSALLTALSRGPTLSRKAALDG